ncbi:MAG: LemA family protein [Tunicatimonas sp.]|uniref:LemA family protein n=1 Tax=Tunicatimonas sp. TaxID=1940096 RepID=UPI003C794943
MAQSDQALEDYLKKLMEIQYGSQEEHQFTQKELKDIALDAGLTESAWQQSQERAQQHLQRGTAYLNAQNYEDAANELENAASLMPHSAEANHLAAKAFLFRGNRYNRSNDYDRAEYYINRTLSIKPAHPGVMQLKTELNNKRRVLSNNNEQKSRSNKFTKWGIIGGVAILLIAGYFNIYNSMVGLEEGVNSSWAQVENQYQRRADLIPNLVETVEGAADYERETLREVVEARAAATSIQIDVDDLDDAGKLAEYAQAQENLGGSLSRLIAVAEQYPTLTATENFRDLQNQLEGTENRISTERRRFNESVQNYNAKARRFPNNLLGFDTKEYFSTDPANAEPPSVNFNE